MSKVLVLYYSSYGHIEAMAAAVAEGAREAGQAGGLWMRGALHGKVGGAFTSTATQHGGQETTLFSIITNLLHFGMVVVGLDYGHAGQMTLDEITGGSPYGATTITGGDGSRMPTANELVGARYQGRKIAEIANKLHG